LAEHAERPAYFPPLPMGFPEPLQANDQRERMVAGMRDWLRRR